MVFTAQIVDFGKRRASPHSGYAYTNPSRSAAANRGGLDKGPLAATI
jgi:hypothetical protein